MTLHEMEKLLDEVLSKKENPATTTASNDYLSVKTTDKGFTHFIYNGNIIGIVAPVDKMIRDFKVKHVPALIPIAKHLRSLNPDKKFLFMKGFKLEMCDTVEEATHAMLAMILDEKMMEEDAKR